jgi:DNA repair exonuclease SbcCD ATPase subunit
MSSNPKPATACACDKNPALVPCEKCKEDVRACLSAAFDAAADTSEIDENGSSSSVAEPRLSRTPTKTAPPPQHVLRGPTDWHKRAVERFPQLKQTYDLVHDLQHKVAISQSMHEQQQKHHAQLHEQIEQQQKLNAELNEKFKKIKAEHENLELKFSEIRGHNLELEQDLRRTYRERDAIKQRYELDRRHGDCTCARGEPHPQLCRLCVTAEALYKARVERDDAQIDADKARRERLDEQVKARAEVHRLEHELGSLMSRTYSLKRTRYE